MAEGQKEQSVKELAGLEEMRRAVLEKMKADLAKFRTTMTDVIASW